MNRRAEVYMYNFFAGTLQEVDTGYEFAYNASYLETENAKPVSKTLPLQAQPFKSNILFPFFDGLIPEGWLLDIAEKNWKLNYRDRMGLLLACCQDCIGAVSIKANNEEL